MQTTSVPPEGHPSPRVRPFPVARVVAAGALAVACTVAAVAGSPTPVALAGSVKMLYVTHGGSSSGPCSSASPCNSLQRAVAVANAEGFTDTPIVIEVGPGQFVTHLNLPDRSYPEPSLTIVGRGDGVTVLSGGGTGPILDAASDAPPITVVTLSVEDARNATTTDGGAVHDGGNKMTFEGVTFSSNLAVDHDSTGGAIDDDGGLVTIDDSTFADNEAEAPSTTAPSAGGAIAEQGGRLTIDRSTLVGNDVTTAGSGGAIYAEGGHLKVVDSTIVDNDATGTASGGAIGLESTSSATVVGSTLNGNEAAGAGGLVAGAGGSKISFGASVLVANTSDAGTACSHVRVADLGDNVTDVATCGLTASTTRLATAADVHLQPLADNGGPTKTERITKQSVAHDLVPATASIDGAKFCSGTDERTVTRQQGRSTHCDAGGYQFAPPVITATTPSSGPPGTEITVDGYGFSFLQVTFAGSSSFSYSDTNVLLTAPHVATTRTETITLRNPDGSAATTFKIVVK